MDEPRREEVELWPGITLLEFGASWCPICCDARPKIDRAAADAPTVRHVLVDDGPGRRLGRSYRVKLWPTLVVLRDGAEVARMVRPRTEREIRGLLEDALRDGRV